MVESKKSISATQEIVNNLRKCDETTSKRLAELLYNDKPEKIQKWHALFKDSIFFPKQSLTLDQQRDIAFKRLKKVADAKLFSIYDF
jgi:hypothetical protein